MSIALFVESNAGELDNLPATAQTLLFAQDNKIVTYHRISNGTKGKGQAWKPVDSTNELPMEYVTNTPVGIVLTERDMALAELDSVTNISIKAIYASENADRLSDIEKVTHREMVANLTSRLIYGDQTLAEYVVDKRSNTGIADNVVINPINVVADTNTNTPVVEREPELVGATSDNWLDLITVPDPKWGKEYINRRVNGVLDWEILDHALANTINVRIEGEAGSGKTICVQGYASARGLRYFNVSSNNGIDPSQLFGRWIPREDGHGYRWQDGAVTQIVRHGGVLLLNEVNFLPARVSTVLFSLLDYRREIQLLENGGEVVKAHPNLLIVADMNYGYKGTQELNQAFSDRFGIKLEFPYDKTIESKLIKSKAVLSLAGQLRDQYDKEELTTPISTRSLVSFVDNIKSFGTDFAITSFVNGFNKDERNGVRLACETHKDNISMDFGLKVTAHPVSADEGEYMNFYQERV